MNTDAYCCPNCGYLERERPEGPVPDRATCPDCFASSTRLVTPPIVARTNPAVRERVATMSTAPAETGTPRPATVLVPA